MKGHIIGPLSTNTFATRGGQLVPFVIFIAPWFSETATRAQGQGRIQRMEGLERILSHFGAHVVYIDLLPVGAPRRNWRQTLIADGYLVVRHPDL